MHTHFGNYEERKERTVSIMENYIHEEIPYERKHDIADALCITILGFLTSFGSNNFKSICYGFEGIK